MHDRTSRAHLRRLARSDFMPLGSAVRLALGQFSPTSQKPKENLEIVKALVGKKKADVWLFPQLFLTAASPETAYRHAETNSGISPTFLHELAKEKEAFAIGSYIAKNPKDKHRPFLRHVAYNPEGKRIAEYDQIQLSTIRGEISNYSAGKKIPFFDVLTFRSAMIGSNDLRYPHLSHEFAMCNGFVLFVSGAYAKNEIHHWDSLLQARAAENQMFVVGCNFGSQKKMGDGNSGSQTESDAHSFGGHSAVFDPFGKKIHQAGEGDQVLILDIDPFQVEWNRNRYQIVSDSKYKREKGLVYPSKDDPE